MDSVTGAITRVAAASLELNYPTMASIPHSIVNGYKNVLAVSVATDYDFPLAEKVGACTWWPDFTGHVHAVATAFWEQDVSLQRWSCEQQCESLCK